MMKNGKKRSLEEKTLERTSLNQFLILGECWKGLSLPIPATKIVGKWYACIFTAKKNPYLYMTKEKKLFPSDRVSKKNSSRRLERKTFSYFFRNRVVLFYCFFYLDSTYTLHLFEMIYLYQNYFLIYFVVFLKCMITSFTTSSSANL